MNKTLPAVFATAALAASLAGARADLTMNGAVGLPLNPTAQIPEKGGVRLQLDYFDYNDFKVQNTVGLGDRTGADTKFYGVHAAGRIGERIEISGGIERLAIDTKTPPFAQDLYEPYDKTGIALGAKYLITRQNEELGQDLGKLRLAVGAGYSRARLKNIHVYAVATKDFRSSAERAPIVGHLGVRYDRFKIPAVNPGAGFISASNETSKKFSVFAGAEVPVTRSGTYTVVGEIGTKTAEEYFYTPANTYTTKFPYSLSIRYRPPQKGFSASIGIQRQGLAAFRDNGLFGQIGYTF